MKSLKKKYYGFLLSGLVIIILLIPISLILVQEENKDMKCYRFQALNITSAQLPVNTHLWFALDSGSLYLVDSVDRTKVYYSDDKGDNWTQLDVDPSDSSGDNKSRDLDIQAAWHDRTNKKIWFVDCDNPGDDVDVWTLDYSVSESSPTITEIGTVDAGDDNSAEAWDIFDIGGTHYILFNQKVAAFNFINIYEVDAAPFTQRIHQAFATLYYSYVTIISGVAYFKETDGVGGIVLSFTPPNVLDTTLANLNGYIVPDDNRRWSTYDDSDLILMCMEKVADGKYYLISYSISGDSYTEGSEYDIIMMLNRNCKGSYPYKYEKAFDSTAEIVYQIKPRKGGIIQLQDCSGISDASLIVINDQFLMNSDGDMFEYDDITSKMEDTWINDGIWPCQKDMAFICHPDDEHNFERGDTLEILDDSNNLILQGKTIDKNRKETGIYRFYLESYANEANRVVYTHTYTTDTTGEKLQDILDNGCSFLYRSSSITATATDYSYDFDSKISDLFFLARFMERQVIYSEPDGLTYSKDYDALTATGESWDLADSSQNVLLTDYEKNSGYYKGSLGITRATVRMKGNTIRTKPSNYEELEQKAGIIPLKEYFDSKIEATTEADQLADNLHDIFSQTTTFLSLRYEGQGFLLPGKTIQIEDTGDITISQAHFLIVSLHYSPKHDIGFMIVSDNIIYPNEFFQYNAIIERKLEEIAIKTIENQADLASHAADPDAHQDAVTYTPNADDTQIDWATDGAANVNWQDLDLDDYYTVPAGCVGVNIRAKLEDDVPGSNCRIATTESNPLSLICDVQVANREINPSGIVWLGSGNILKIKTSIVPGAFTTLSFCVLGWWIQS